MNEIRIASEELATVLPHYQFEDSHEVGLYFRGLMAKAIDSLRAIDLLESNVGPVWPLHCRWIIESFGYASALNDDEKIIKDIKRLGAKTYLLIADVDEETRKRVLDSISPTELPNVETLLRKFEEKAGVTETGSLYKIYRLLCEYTHFEFFRTVAYPGLGVESHLELEKRKSLFLRVTAATALSLPSLAHCPPSCGFDEESFEKISNLRDGGWKKLKSLSD